MVRKLHQDWHVVRCNHEHRLVDSKCQSVKAMSNPCGLHTGKEKDKAKTWAPLIMKGQEWDKESEKWDSKDFQSTSRLSRRVEVLSTTLLSMDVHHGALHGCTINPLSVGAAAVVSASCFRSWSQRAHLHDQSPSRRPSSIEGPNPDAAETQQTHEETSVHCDITCYMV